MFSFLYILQNMFIILIPRERLMDFQLFYVFIGSLTTSTAASTGFSLGFGKPAASAAPFSMTTPSSAATGTGLTLGSVLTATAPQTSSTGFSLNLGGAASTSSAPALGFSFGSNLFSNPSLTG